MASTSTRGFLSASSNFTVIMLVTADMAGVLFIFNMNHWLITDAFADNLLLTWKLVLVAAFVFLYNYLMDLYTFDSALSQLGMLERSLIAMLLTAITVMIVVYLIGPGFIGGFVGRGVLASSLIMVWLWALGARYLMNTWIKGQRGQIQWLVLCNGDMDEFIRDFRSFYGVERLLLLRNPDAPPPESDDPAVASIGTWNDLKLTLVNNPVNGVIVSAPDKMPDELIDKLMEIRIGGVRIYTMSDFYEKYLARLPVFHLNQQWIAMTHGFELIHNPIGLRFKRYIDIAIALAGGLLLLPLITGLAITIFMTSGMPVLYRQVRTGENDRAFTLYKFRTMVADAEPDGARFAQEDDPRITSLGGVMRKFRLDELPQLWNVLTGDMSFIGPRPERPEFVEQLEDRIPYYSLRHIVKPGITGWAQVMFGYGDSTEDATTKLQYDLFYIKNYSLILDISILVKSIKVILFGTGR